MPSIVNLAAILFLGMHMVLFVMVVILAVVFAHDAGKMCDGVNALERHIASPTTTATSVRLATVIATSL